MTAPPRPSQWPDQAEWPPSPPRMWRWRKRRRRWSQARSTTFTAPHEVSPPFPSEEVRAQLRAEHDALVKQVLDQRADFLRERFVELRSQGWTAVSEGPGSVTAWLVRRRFRHGMLMVQTLRSNGGATSWSRVTREDAGQPGVLEFQFCSRFAEGLANLRR